jgi:hypothetical protein
MLSPPDPPAFENRPNYLLLPPDPDNPRGCLALACGDEADPIRKELCARRGRICCGCVLNGRRLKGSAGACRSSGFGARPQSLMNVWLGRKQAFPSQGGEDAGSPSFAAFFEIGFAIEARIDADAAEVFQRGIGIARDAAVKDEDGLKRTEVV